MFNMNLVTSALKVIVFTYFNPCIHGPLQGYSEIILSILQLIVTLFKLVNSFIMFRRQLCRCSNQTGLGDIIARWLPGQKRDLFI